MSNVPPPGSPRKKAARPRPAAISRRVREMVDPRLQYERLIRELRSYAPGVGISVGVHLILAIILVLVVMRQPVTPRGLGVTAKFIDPTEIPKEPEEKAIELPTLKPPAEGEVDGGPAARKTPAPGKGKPIEVVVLNPNEVGVGDMLGGRGTGRRGLVASGGGSDESEDAVQLGLSWLKRFQEKDGRWQLTESNEKPPRYPDPGIRSLKTDTGATALALLSFLGSGHTHKEGAYKKEVNAALQWLLQQQNSDGNLYDQDELGHQQSFYAHGQATIALCEAYGLTKDETLRAPAEKAIAYICASQHPVKGGWKYRPQSEGDLSVFGWQIMALQSARMAGLTVPDETLGRATAFLDLVQVDNGARYRYEAVDEFKPTPAMTAEGLLCRQYLGWPREMPAMQEGIEYITRPEHLPDWSSGKRNVYFWYYGTQTLHNVQGKAWDTWNRALLDAVVTHQVREGAQRGSWHPKLPVGAHDENADKAGRLYITSLCILTLEVYYRHLPLYKPPTPDKPAIE
jgi:hypothetical protein